MNALCRIELLGGLRIRRRGQTLSRFPTYKTGALLAYLAYYRHSAHPREVLIELLWPDVAPEAGRQSLSQALSSLRHQLEPPGVPAGGILAADRATVQICTDAVTTDVAEWEAAWQAAKAPDAALETLLETARRYTGPLLPGFYENWTLQERERWNEAYLHLMDRVVAGLEQAGEGKRALEYARLALGIDPLREETQVALIRLYMGAGEPAAALRQFYRYERLLEKELGLTPSPEMRALVQKLAFQPRRARSAVSEVARTPSHAKVVAALPGTQAPGLEETQEARPVPDMGTGLMGDLPRPITRFFGREAEIARLVELVSKSRLVTLTGLGGIGKTRLALEGARVLHDAFAGRIWFVPLAEIRDPGLILPEIVTALGLPTGSGEDLLAQAVEALSRQPSLLILDNFEQLLPVSEDEQAAFQQGRSHGAEIVQRLLEKTPGLTCLVTSRRMLGLIGERELLVMPLPTPYDTHTLEEVAESESVALFVDRATAVRPDFQVTKGNFKAISRLSERLEGIPLALELAAARAQVLTPAQMLAQIEKRFDFLVSRKRDLAYRHRALRTTLDWSYHLLSPELQYLFGRLSVFRGGCTLEAAEAILAPQSPASDFAKASTPTEASFTRATRDGEPPENPKPNIANLNILDLLEQLRECSMLLTREAEDEIRFRMLETVSAYAEQVLTLEERAEASRLHALYFLKLAERWDALTVGAEQASALSHLEREQDNLRAALDWAFSAREEEMSLRLSTALCRFWEVRGYLTEGRQRLDAILKASGDARTAARAKALSGAANLASAQGDYATVKTYQEESLDIFRELEDRQGMATALGNLGNAAYHEGDYAGARTYQEESLQLRRELKDRYGIAASLNTLGNLAYEQCDYAAALLWYQESLGLWREIGDRRGVALLLGNLGNVTYAQGEYAATRTYREESLAIFRELGDRRYIAWSLGNLGNVACNQGEYPTAHANWEECLTIFREIGDQRHIAWSLNGLGDVAQAEGDYAAAQAYFEESLILRREIREKGSMAIALNNLGDIAYILGAYSASQAYFEESLALCRELGDRQGISVALYGLGNLAHVRHDEAAALARFQECLTIFWEIRDLLNIASMLEQFARLAAARHRMESAVVLWGAADALRQSIGAPMALADRDHHEKELTEAHSNLGEAPFLTAWEQGRAMSLDRAVAFALESPLSSPPA
ncbi:MAG TPA: tetratricopeptide repeat protein [Chthonomonadaceae bacterium]|nr:tetratricopeptide repeat protein [Chthonomonadaceae bacterium]